MPTYEVPPMTPTAEKIKSPPHKNKLATRWILIILLVPLLFTARWVTPAYGSYAPILENLLVTPSITPTATATATSTSELAATQTPAPYSTQKTTVKVAGRSVYLRTGPGTNFEVVRKLTFGELLMLLGRLSDNTWLYVKGSDGQEGWIQTTWVDLARIDLYNDYHPVQTSPPTPTSTRVVLVGIESHWIDIDLSEQMLYAYDGTDLVASFLVSTGLDIYPTEIGQYKIYVKMNYSDMHGDDYFLPDVPYTMYYSGDFSIHGTYWHHNFGTRMSRGCVNMDISEAEWLYNWSSVGTLVNIHR